MKNRYRNLSLALLPFAMALTAHAGAITLSTDNFICSADAFDCQNSAGVNSLLNGGVSFYVDNTETIYSNGTLNESVAGSVSGSLASGSQIGYSYDFSLDYLEPVDPNWALTITIVHHYSTIATTTIHGTYSSQDSGPFTGSGDMTTINSFDDGNDLTVEYTLTISGAPNGSKTYITVPNNASVDIDPNVSSTPEPASLGLMGAGLVGAGLLGRKRRKK